MKLFFACVAAMAATTVAAPAAAQLPPELLGGGGPQGPIHSEAFYKSAEGFWVLMRNPQNDGLRCAVNFITGDAVMTVHGPWDATMASKNTGMVWFDGKNIPSQRTPTPAQITVTSLDPARTMPAIHASMGQRNGTFIVPINIKEMLKEKRDTDDIGIQFQGREVMRIKPFRLQEAYRKLETCMAAGSARGSATDGKKKR